MKARVLANVIGLILCVLFFGSACIIAIDAAEDISAKVSARHATIDAAADPINPNKSR